MTELTSGETAERGTSAASVAELPAGTVEVVPVRALLLGERLDTRALERDKPLGVAPLTVEIPGGGGVAVVFRYGAVVLFGPPNAALDDFVAGLRPLVTAAFPVPERDDARLLIRPDAEQHVDLAGNIFSARRRPRACRLSPTSSARAWFCRITRRGSPTSLTASSRSPRRCGRKAASGRGANSCYVTSATCC